MESEKLKRSKRYPLFDMYAAPVPGFNIRGRDLVMTGAGTCLTMTIIIVTLAFAMIKLQQMM